MSYFESNLHLKVFPNPTLWPHFRIQENRFSKILEIDWNDKYSTKENLFLSAHGNVSCFFSVSFDAFCWSSNIWRCFLKSPYLNSRISWTWQFKLRKENHIANSDIPETNKSSDKKSSPNIQSVWPYRLLAKWKAKHS